MGRADLSRIQVLKRREMVDDPSLYGVVDVTAVPPAIRTLNLVSETLKGQVDTKVSGTATADQLPGPTRRTAVVGSGPVNYELTPGPQMDEVIEEVLCEEFSTELGISSADIDFVAADNSINDSLTAGTLFANVVEGQWIRIEDATTPGNNTDGVAGNPEGAYVLTKVNNDKLILAYHTIADEIADATPVLVKGKYVRNGTKLISNTYERENTDFTAGGFQHYPGQVAAGGEFNFTFEEIITAAIALQGMGPQARASVSVWDGLTITPVENIQDLVPDVSNNMRAFRAGGTLDGNVKVFNFNHVNNVEHIKLGQVLDPAGQSLGTKGLTGNLNAYLVEGDGRQTTAFDHAATDFHVMVVPDIGPIYVITIFRLKFTDMGDTPKTAATGPAPLDLPWTAEKDATTAAWIQFSSLPTA